jgi:hypothetical protein
MIAYISARRHHKQLVQLVEAMRGAPFTCFLGPGFDESLVLPTDDAESFVSVRERADPAGLVPPPGVTTTTIDTFCGSAIDTASPIDSCSTDSSCSAPNSRRRRLLAIWFSARTGRSARTSTICFSGGQTVFSIEIGCFVLRAVHLLSKVLTSGLTSLSL